MKQLFVHIIILFIFSSCVTDRPWYEDGQRVQVSTKTANYFSSSLAAESYPIDSTLFEKLIDNGSSELCAMVASFGMSEVKLERELPNMCHKQVFNFDNCDATLQEDTLVVLFNTLDPRRRKSSNKLMKVRIFGDDHHSEIIHWGEEIQEITQIDGTISMRPAPKSIVIQTKLKLNKNSYEVGDTIIGELKITSVQYKGRRRIKVKEKTNGKFRAIVSGYDLECGTEEILVHSWLKE